MGVFLVHSKEWAAILILLIVLVSTRINNVVEESKIRAKNTEEDALYKDAHQAALVKEWVTSQYCKTDIDILCPEEVPTKDSCYAAFDPPLLFVLDLTENSKEKQPTNCEMKNLFKELWEEHHENVEEINQDDLLTSLIAHVMRQVRTKSAQYFRAEDRSILEFEQSRLIELSLASFLDLFSSPTKQEAGGKIIATKATEFGLTKHIWSRDEVVLIMDDAVMYHTHHQRHGSSEAGAAGRLSRQQPSFVFKFLPLVKEQIENLQYDSATERKLRKLYPIPELDGTAEEMLALDEDPPEMDHCLKRHYEEGSLISGDCILALDTAPLKIRDLDWEGDFFMVLIHIYTGLSAAFLLVVLSRLRSSTTTVRDQVDSPIQDAIIGTASMDMALSNATTASKDNAASHGDRIRKMQKVCVVYVTLSCLVGIASSYTSQTIRFSDFIDGLCLALIGFLSLSLVPMTQDGDSSSIAMPAKRNSRKLFHKSSSPLDDATTEESTTKNKKVTFADLT